MRPTKTGNALMDAAAIDKAIHAKSLGKDSNYARVFTGLLFLLFIVTMLMAIMMGTNVYKNLQAIQDKADNQRSGANLISSIVHTNDAIDAVAIGEGPEGQSLVLVENTASGSYETRIYKYQGKIVEEYSIEGTPYNPQRAISSIIPANTFSVSYSKSLLSVETDEGTVKIDLRAVKGGA